MKPILWIVLGLLVLIGGYFAWDYLGARPPSASKLSEQALAPGDTEDQKKARLQAVSALTMLKDQKSAVPELQRVVKESKDTDVLVAAIHGLMGMNDPASVPLVIAKLDNSEQQVREAAFKSVKKYYGNDFPKDIQYNVNDTADNHAKVISKLQDFHTNKADPLGYLKK